MYENECPVKRPSEKDEEPRKEVATMIYGEFVKRGELAPDEEGQAVFVRHLTHELKSYSHCGYHLAKGMEDLGWPMDANAVEILDWADSYMMSVLQGLTKAWAAEHGIVPRLAVGDKVMLYGEERTVLEFDGSIKYRLSPQKSDGPHTIAGLYTYLEVEKNL